MNELELFAEAIAIENPIDRAALLDRKCNGQNDLKNRLIQLLDAHMKSRAMLDRPLRDPDATAAQETMAGHVGAIIAGRYKLLEEIGDGGMGSVWMAEQKEPVKRLVAIKLIKAGMDSKAVLARFEAERQALALMDHPNIAKVHDAGTDDHGRPYFVMELVKGLPLTEYCDNRKLSVNERLDLFVQICSAVQHAHQKAIIHRDLKPSNVLVTEHDGKPVPKVIDFGLAKALNSSQMLTDRTLHTAYGTVVGTPLYMAPEQVGINALDVDTRTDIYALGVILYELLTGTTPLEKARFKEAAWEEVKRLIREEEPLRPSARISSDATLPSLAASRQIDPIQLCRLVRGELDWIVMKALDKDRSRRYETANGLAKDVERYLKGDAVEACPPTLSYRLRKMYSQNRTTVHVGIGVVISLVALAATLAYGVSEAGKSVRLQELLGQAESARADAESARETLGRVEYARSIGLAYREFEAGHHEWATELLEKCGDRYRGWEWHFLARQFHPEEICLTHSKPVVCVAVSLDGSIAATGDSSGAFHLWDASTGKRIRTIETKEPFVNSVVFTPDGSRLITADYHSVRAWRVSNGAEELKFDHPDNVFAAAISTDGKRIATSCQDRVVRVWDADTGKVVLAVNRYKHVGGKIEFSRDGRLLVFENGKDQLAVIDASSGVEIYSPRNSEYARCPRFSPDGSTIAFATGGYSDISHHIDGYNQRTSKQMVWLDAGRSVVNDFIWSADGKRITAVSDDHTIRVWDVSQRELLHSFRGHAGPITAIAWTEDEQRLVTASRDGTARIWSTVRYPRNHIARPETGVNALAVSTDSRRVVIGGKGEVQVWDLRTGRRLWRANQGEKWIEAVTFTPDGRRIVTGGEDLSLVLRDATTGEPLATRDTKSLIMRFVAVHPDGSVVATNGPHGSLQLLSAENLTPIRTVDHPADPIWSAAFSPDGRWLITTAGGDGKLRFWDTSTWMVVNEVNCGDAMINSLSFSADGSRLAGRVKGGEVIILDVPAEKILRSIPCPRLGGRMVALSPDGKRVAAAGHQGHVHVWDVDSGSEMLNLVFHESVILLNTPPSEVYPMAFTPDGNTLVTSGYDQSIRIWDGKARSTGPIGNRFPGASQ